MRAGIGIRDFASRPRAARPAAAGSQPISQRAAAGFTLLEVVVALVIAGLALVVLFRAGGEGLFAVQAASRAEQAVERAQSHLAAVGRDVPLLAGESEGDDGGGYRWHLRIAPVQRWVIKGATGAVAVVTTLYDVEIHISWPGRDHDHAVVLNTERVATASGGE